MAGLKLWPERPALSRRGFALSEATLSGVLQALSRALAAEEERWFPCWLVAFGAGVLCYFGLPEGPSGLVAAVVALAAAVLGLRASKSRTATTRFLCAAIAASGLGFGAAKLRTERVAAPIITRGVGP